tara:strand:- start:92 stop:625 length:534 start_codon:yes stop_codon:yes gene_type:complete
MSEKLDKELIALDELESEDDTYTISEEQVQIKDVHADQLLWKIGELEREIETLKDRQIESSEFYDRRIDSVQNQIRFRAHLLEMHMQSENKISGKKTNKLPNGVLRLTTRTKKTFADDEALMAFSFKNSIPTRVIEKPDRKAISEHIKVWGDAPDICTEEVETKFSFKTTTNKTTEE